MQNSLDGLSVLADKLRQVVGNGDVEPVDGTTAEIRASRAEQWEFVQSVQSEEVSVDVRVGQIVPRYVGQGAETLVDVIVLRVLDDTVRCLLLLGEEALVVVVGRQVAVNHLRVVTHSYLQLQFHIIPFLLIS